LKLFGYFFPDTRYLPPADILRLSKLFKKYRLVDDIPIFSPGFIDVAVQNKQIFDV